MHYYLLGTGSIKYYPNTRTPFYIQSVIKSRLQTSKVCRGEKMELLFIINIYTEMHSFYKNGLL